jgi:hypothetical protein
VTEHIVNSDGMLLGGNRIRERKFLPIFLSGDFVEPVPPLKKGTGVDAPLPEDIS